MLLWSRPASQSSLRLHRLICIRSMHLCAGRESITPSTYPHFRCPSIWHRSLPSKGQLSCRETQLGPSPLRDHPTAETLLSLFASTDGTTRPRNKRNKRAHDTSLSAHRPNWPMDAVQLSGLLSCQPARGLPIITLISASVLPPMPMPSRHLVPRLHTMPRHPRGTYSKMTLSPPPGQQA